MTPIFMLLAWQIQMSGFVESDFTYDAKPSFLESAGNNPIVGPDSPRGQGERKQISLRHSRLAFAVLPPDQEAWKTKAYAEFDFLGNQLNWPLAGSRDTYYTDPSLRIRHLYFSAIHDDWHLLIGQYWSLFGWQPTYQLTTASVSPGPGILSQRTKQFTAIKTWNGERDGQWQAGLSFAQASQKAGGAPNIDAGVKYSYSKLKSQFASASGEAKAEPLSVGLSGTMRKFATGSTSALSDNLKKAKAFAVAVDALIPVAPSLTLTAEYSTGTGHGKAFPGWSGNLPQFPFSPPSSEDTYLSKGIGGFDGDGNFHLFRLQSWNAQLQYHLPFRRQFFVTGGYAELNVSNVTGLGPVPGGFVAYDKVSMYFANLFHDFTREVRGAVEYARFATHYVNSDQIKSDRCQVSVFYRF